MKHPILLNELMMDLESSRWTINSVDDPRLIGPVAYGWDRYLKDPCSLTFGGGVLAGSPLPGTRRMIFCGYSALWEGFYVSALGGAMYVFHRTGLNYTWLRGQCQTTSVLLINHQAGMYDIRLEPVDPEPLWAGYKDRNGKIWEGFHGLQHALFDRYKDRFDGDWLRILAVGPGAKRTNMGAIGSNQVRHGDLSNTDDWAGRGGLGSRLLQFHNLAGVVFGGDWQDPELKNSKELDQYFLDHFGQRAIASDMVLSQKYRYVPEFNTGGTFGVNMHTAEDRLFSFNYNSVYQPDENRYEQHQNFIAAHYLKQFNEETIAPKHFDHCGEPCPIACKKLRAEFKKDYEPYQALGPNCGIFDQRAAERINKYVDILGIDSIQAGGMVSWIMESIHDGSINPEAWGLTLPKPRIGFVSSPAEFDLVVDSAHNADYAIAILQMIVFSEKGEPFRKGLRAAAKWIDQEQGTHTLSKAVYTAHGLHGCMVPNQYWAPGMFAPMPLMGKYFSYYGNEFIPPRKLGKKNVERWVYEFYSENSGSCRFHRKWVEDIIDEIILSHFDIDLQYWQENFLLAKAIFEHQGSCSVFWESERVVDIILGFLENWKHDGLQSVELEHWLSLFKQDKWSAARTFWQEMYDGMAETFTQGIAEPHHQEHGMIETIKAQRG